MSYEKLPPSLVINALVHRVSELLGRSKMITSDQAAAHLIDENPQAVMPVESSATVTQPQRDLLETFKCALDGVVEGTLLALNTSQYNAGIDGIVNMVADVQNDIRELARHFPAMHDEQVDTMAVVTSLSDVALLQKSRHMRLFSASDELDTIRNMVASEIDRTRSHAMRLKRLGTNASASREQMTRAVRSAVASAKMATGSASKGVHAIAAIIKSTGSEATRRGSYEALVRIIDQGSRLPAGLPRSIDMCARRVVQTEHIKRCSQWNAQANCNSRRSRVYITDAIAIDLSATVKSEELDEQGKFVVDQKVRESRLLGVLDSENAQAQVLMAMYDVDRLLHVEVCGTDQTETWILRCDRDTLLEMLRELRCVVISKVLGRCVVTKGAPLVDLHGHACGDASCMDVRRQSSGTVTPELDGIWACRDGSCRLFV